MKYLTVIIPLWNLCWRIISLISMSYTKGTKTTSSRNLRHKYFSKKKESNIWNQQEMYTKTHPSTNLCQIYTDAHGIVITI